MNDCVSELFSTMSYVPTGGSSVEDSSSMYIQNPTSLIHQNYHRFKKRLRTKLKKINSHWLAAKFTVATFNILSPHCIKKQYYPTFADEVLSWYMFLLCPISVIIIIIVHFILTCKTGTLDDIE